MSACLLPHEKRRLEAERAVPEPFPLSGRTARERAKLPRYYVMDLNKGMAETVAAEMPSAAAIAAHKA